MSAPVMTIEDSHPIAAAEQKLGALGISGIAVVDRTGALVGVVSRTDLLRVGRARRGGHERTLVLPKVPVREIMTATVEIIAPETELAEAARRMVRQRIHRLYVAEDRRPQGVVSTVEMMKAVAAAELPLPVEQAMHGSLVVVRASDPVSLAVDRMTAAHHHGVVVVEDGWPVGVFTQSDALAARDAPPDDRVGQWMDPRVLCVPLAMPVFRAAAQASAMRARRILAVDGTGVRGILTGMDFAKVVHRAAQG
jgi:CBS domain-containing protein